MLLPALTLSVIPTGIIARTVRSQVADILSQSLSLACARPRAQRVAHLCPCHEKCRATALAVMGLQVGYLMGGSSILAETVFSAGNRIAAQYRHFFSATCPAAGHHLGAGAVFSCCSTCWWIFCRPPLDPRIKRELTMVDTATTESGPGRSGPRYPARLLARRAAAILRDPGGVVVGVVILLLLAWRCSVRGLSSKIPIKRRCSCA